MATVAVGWQVYSVRENPLDLGARRARGVPPASAARAARGPSRGSRLAPAPLPLHDHASTSASRSGCSRSRSPAPTEVWPFFALAFAHGSRKRDRSACGARAHALARAAGDPRQRARAALDRASSSRSSPGPAVGGLLFAIQAELVYVVGIALSLVALGCVLAIRAGRVAVAAGAADLEEVLAGVRLIRRTKVLFGAISLDLFAVLLGGAVALLPIFAKDILEVGPTGLGLLRASPAVGSFVAALFLARRPIRRRAGPTLFLVVAGFGASMVVFGLSREMWLSMLALALGGGVRPGQRRPPLDDPPAGDARRAARTRERRRDGLHQRVERARRVRVRRRGGARRRRSGGRLRRCRDDRDRRSLVATVPVAGAGRPAGRLRPVELP